MREDDSAGWSAALEEARKAIHAGQFEQAREILDAAITRAEAIWGNSDGRLIEALRLLAGALWRGHSALDPNNGAELAALNRALAISRAIRPVGHIETAELAGLAGLHMMTAGQLEDGCVLMNECLDIARENGCERDFARYLHILGDIRLKQARTSESLSSFQRLAELYAEGPPNMLADAWRRCGECLFLLGQHGEAVEHLEKAAALIDKDRDARNIALLSDILELLDRVERSKPSYPDRGSSPPPTS